MIKSFKIALGLFAVFTTSFLQAQTSIIIKTTPYEKLPAIPYVEKSAQQIQLEKDTRTFVPIYPKHHLNYYASKMYPLPMYGGWSLRPIHRYGCRSGDLVLVNAKGIEKKFPIKTDRGDDKRKNADKLEALECPADLAPRLLNSWIMNSRYVVFETSDPGFVAFDFIKGEFVKNMVLKTQNISIGSTLNGEIFFNSPDISKVEQNRFFVDENGDVLKAPIDQEIHKYAFAFREYYICQESLSWGEPCVHQDQLERIFKQKH